MLGSLEFSIAIVLEYLYARDGFRQCREAWLNNAHIQRLVGVLYML
jgi:hypothetical protein